MPIGHCMEKAAFQPVLFSFSVLSKPWKNKGTISVNLPHMDARKREGGFTFQPRSAGRRTNTISIHAKNLRKSQLCLYFPCIKALGLIWDLQAVCGPTGWGEGARPPCCTAGARVPSPESPGSKELQQPVLQALPNPWSALPGVVLECALSQTLEKRVGKWDLHFCLVICFGRRMGYCNAQSSFLSSPGSLYKPVELLWSSTSVSLRRIKWSIMRGWNQTSGIWWKSFRTSSTNRHVLHVGGPQKWFSLLEN